MHRYLLLFAGLCAAIGSSQTAAQTSQELLPEIELPPAYISILRAYEQGWEARDADALADLFTEDGFVLRPGHTPVRGRAAIRKAYANSGGPLVLRGYGFAAADSVGYIVGGFARTKNDTDVGKFVLALRLTQDGHWRIAADMDNGNHRP